MSATRDWNTYEGKPAGSDSISAGDNEIRDTKVDVRERMAVDHLWNDSVTQDGFHRVLHLPGTGVVSAATSYGILQCKTGTGGHIDLVYLSGTQNTSYIIKQGGIQVGTLTSSSYLLSGNSAGSGNVNLIRSNTFDLIQMGTALVPFVVSNTGVCTNLNADWIDGVSPAFGTWLTKSVYTAQTALTDGTVHVTMYAGTTTSNNASAIGYTDSASNPTTARVSGHCFFNGDANYYADYGGLTMDVKKGDYWKVVVAGTPASIAVYFAPHST